LEVTVAFANFALKDMTLDFRGKLSIFVSGLAGGESNQSAIKTLTIVQRGISLLSSWRFDLTESLLADVRKAVSDCLPIRVKLVIEGRDNKGAKCVWETEELTMLLLTRVN
jgi:hypothetical protein